ncbi:hypothetical protein GCM10010460_19190 [Microbacterium terrae]|nr:hypothetical protein GCM10017594_07410 [Microbacterium terrae]
MDIVQNPARGIVRKQSVKIPQNLTYSLLTYAGLQCEKRRGDRVHGVSVSVRRRIDALTTLRLAAAPAFGRGAVLVVERLLSDARQRGVCKE